MWTAVRIANGRPIGCDVHPAGTAGATANAPGTAPSNAHNIPTAPTATSFMGRASAWATIPGPNIGGLQVPRTINQHRDNYPSGLHGSELAR